MHSEKSATTVNAHRNDSEQQKQNCGKMKTIHTSNNWEKSASFFSYSMLSAENAFDD